MDFAQKYLAELTRVEGEILGGHEPEVLGFAFGDFLKVAGGVAGGVANGMTGGALGGALGGGKGGAGAANADDPITKMMVLQQQQQNQRDQAARDQANRDAAARNQMFMFAGVGIVALGALFFIFKK